MIILEFQRSCLNFFPNELFNANERQSKLIHFNKEKKTNGLIIKNFQFKAHLFAPVYLLYGCTNT